MLHLQHIRFLSLKALLSAGPQGCRLAVEAITESFQVVISALLPLLSPLPCLYYLLLCTWNPFRNKWEVQCKAVNWFQQHPIPPRTAGPKRSLSAELTMGCTCSWFFLISLPHWVSLASTSVVPVSCQGAACWLLACVHLGAPCRSEQSFLPEASLPLVTLCPWRSEAVSLEIIPFWVWEFCG